MGSLKPTTLALIAKYPKLTILGQSETTENAKMVSFKYRGLQTLPHESNRTIQIAVVYIWRPWYTKNDIETSLQLYWVFHVIDNSLHFSG